MMPDLRERHQLFRRLRGVSLSNSVFPAFFFNPLAPSDAFNGPPQGIPVASAPVRQLPENPEEIAFQPLPVLSAWIRTGKIRSVELTRIYLDRLKRLGPRLKCVVTLTEALAMKQAEKADRDLASGHWRGPLHGIPYGIKDLFAVAGTPTTWGAKPFSGRVIDETATVALRLEAAGAVLVAKLSTGALAWGDVWFGGKTRNPWDLEQGSSGSSAGPASATAAALVGFSIGTETWGSIVSPATRCGVTGLRPTFGRVSRHGAMALSWTMDKVGPICRSVEGCALVFAAIHGADENDPTARDFPFHWPQPAGINGLRVGVIQSLFPEKETEGELDQASLKVLRGLGIQLIPLSLPRLPVQPLALILNAEAAAAFDDLTRSGRDDELTRQFRNAWPNVFRHSRLIPAVEYIQANRVRSLLIHEMRKLFTNVDVYICPSFGGDNLLLTNLTGHPALVLPNGFDAKGHPHSITLTGNLFGEEKLLRLGAAIQTVTDFHKRRPGGIAETGEARKP